ncbi:unnamed protein product [Symbiodinium sp. CCMP2592]|nr:unnamed protein product [Symbiodinium sp. CCMP2592]
MSGRASLLQAKLMIPGTDMTFVEYNADQELCYCWGCARCAQTPKEEASNMVRGCDPARVDNLARHASAKQHQAALQQLGFLPQDDAPPLEAPEVATLHIDCSTLASAESIMLQVDIRDMKLCVRFQACTEDLKVHRGVLGFESVCSNSHEEVMRSIQKALTRLCSLEGTLDAEGLEALRDRVDVLNGDEASDMQLALTELQQSTLCTPNLVPTMVTVHDVYQNAIAGKHSITSTIQHSGVVAHKFQQHCQAMESAPSTARRLKNLSLAKHRFDRVEKPLSRFCLYLDAFLLTAISVSASPTSQLRGRGQGFLEWVTEEKILLLGLLADLSDECLMFTRVYDHERYEASLMHSSCQAFVSKLRWLYVKEHAWELGYTAHVLEQLKPPCGFTLNGRARTIGGRSRVTPAIKARCMQALETLEAVFPSFELLACFHILNVAPNVDVRLEEDELAEEIRAHEAIARHEASQGRSTFDAWKQAVLRTSACQRAVREHFPCDNLWKLLTRYDAMVHGVVLPLPALSSCSVGCVTTADRACLTGENLFYAVKVLADVTKANQKDICELEQMCWALISDAPRKSSTSRIDKGVPRKRQCGTEVDFKKKRRMALTDAAEMVPIATTREEVTRLTEELIQADEPVLQELGFQHAKQSRNQIVAFLDGALTEADIPQGLEDVAQAFLEHRDHLKHQRTLSARAYSRVMRPDAPRLASRIIFLQKDDWANKVWARKLQLCARLEDATAILWTVALQGGVVVDCVYMQSQRAAKEQRTHTAVPLRHAAVFSSTMTGQQATQLLQRLY